VKTLLADCAHTSIIGFNLVPVAWFIGFCHLNFFENLIDSWKEYFSNYLNVLGEVSVYFCNWDFLFQTHLLW